jgi:hypothetical protein
MNVECSFLRRSDQSSFDALLHSRHEDLVPELLPAFLGVGKRPRAAMQGLMPWIDKTLKRMHRNLVAIALANKLARIAWAVLARGRTYQPQSLAHAA